MQATRKCCSVLDESMHKLADRCMLSVHGLQCDVKSLCLAADADWDSTLGTDREGSLGNPELHEDAIALDALAADKSADQAAGEPMPPYPCELSHHTRVWRKVCTPLWQVYRRCMQGFPYVCTAG